MNHEEENTEAEPNDIQVDLFLADHAKVSDGKLDALGAGWSQWGGGPNVGPFALAALVKIPASLAGQDLSIELAMFDEDGQLVEHVPQANLKATIAGGMRPGSMVDMPFAIQNIGPLPLVPNRGYEWRATVNGQTRLEWRAPFFVHRGTPPQGMIRPAS